MTLSRAFSASSCARDSAILCATIVAALYFFVGPAAFDLRIPLSYYHDGMSHGFVVKTILDVGWYPVRSPFVGAPFGSDLFDYPFSDGLNFLLVRVLGLGGGDWVEVSNLYFLAGFLLSGLSAYWVMRRLGIVAWWAIAGALLFALLPYHLERRQHLFLSSYATVPLGVWLAYVAWRGHRTAARSSTRRRAMVALVAVAVGAGGVYYAFFSAFLVAVAGAARVLGTRAWRAALPALAIAGVIALTVGINVASTVVFRLTHGPNPAVAVRSPVDAEIYGLRLTQLVLPHGHHRVDRLRVLYEQYAAKAPLVNENASVSLGLAGTLGLAVLAFATLRRLAGTRSAVSPRFTFLALIALSSLAIGTIGGLGAVFAYAVSPMIRGYNRIGVFIAFVSLAALVLALQVVLTRVRAVALVGIACAAGLALVGAADQTPRAYREAQDPTFTSDRNFVRKAEAALPAGTMVWQLPYQPFPEGVPIEQMANYGPLRGYLHSSGLRWSYGAMKGRDADHWIRAVAQHPLSAQLDLVARSGFGAVYVDRRGFADRGAGVESVLRDRLGQPIAESSDGLLAMYRLPSTGEVPLSLQDVLVPVEVPIRFDTPAMPVTVARTEGVSHYEPWGRWTDGEVARITLSRDLPSRFVLRIETAVAFPPSVGVDLVARVGQVQHSFRVGAGPGVVDIPFEAPLAGRTIEILIPAPRSPSELGISADGRRLGIGLKSITVLPRPVGS